MNRRIYGLDIGTSNIKIYSMSGDTILNEKNIIAFSKRPSGPPLTNNISYEREGVYAFGDEAFEMHEKNPVNIDVSFPLKAGVIADFDNMTILFKEFIKKISGEDKKFSPAEFYIAVPADITEVEKRAFYELVKDAKLHDKKIMVINKPIADAVGADVDVNNAQGIMVVNVGADTTEISVLSLGGIVLTKIVKFGGNKLDEQIISSVRKKYNFVIGEKTAEVLKLSLGSAIREKEHFESVYGRDVVKGLPMKKEISSDVIYECMKDFIKQIVDNIKMTLERTPPELAADIIDTGIFLTGGSSSVKNLRDLINNETDLHVNIVKNPSESVVRGIRKIIEDPKYKEIAYVPKARIIE